MSVLRVLSYYVLKWKILRDMKQHTHWLMACQSNVINQWVAASQSNLPCLITFCVFWGDGWGFVYQTPTAEMRLKNGSHKSEGHIELVTSIKTSRTILWLFFCLYYIVEQWKWGEKDAEDTQLRAMDWTNLDCCTGHMACGHLLIHWAKSTPWLLYLL